MIRVGRGFIAVVRTADPAPWFVINRICGKLVGFVLRTGERRGLSIGVLRGRHHA
jgi:hypothetical protein